MSLLNNSRILKSRAFSQSVTVKRKAEGAWAEATGKFTEGAESTITIRASIQPVSDLEKLRQAIEGGSQIHEAIKIYSSFEFSPGTITATGGTVGDIVVYKGLEWSVVRVSDFYVNGHGRIYAVRYDGQND